MNRYLTISYFITVLCLIQSVVVVTVVANDVCNDPNGICICKDHSGPEHFEDVFFPLENQNHRSLSEMRKNECKNPDGTIDSYFLPIWNVYRHRVNMEQHSVTDANGNPTVINISEDYDVTNERFAPFCQKAQKVLYLNQRDKGTTIHCLYWHAIQNAQEEENVFHFQAQAAYFQQYQAQNQDQILRSLSTERQLAGYGNSKDWVKEGYVSDIRNQGGCGSCYSFAATSVLESYQGIQGGEFKDQSAQWAVDCSSSNNGCNGGMMSNVWNDMKGQKTCTQSEYPYSGQEGQCKDQQCSESNLIVEGTKYVQGVDALASAVDNEGPVAAAMDHTPLMHYKGGVISDCQGSGITHAVVVVGYVKNNYWLVRNSWGEDWGDKGYFKLQWGECLYITDYGQYPKIKKPDQDSDHSLYDPVKDEDQEDFNMCDGYCDSCNPHGCCCKSDCEQQRNCCTDFNYQSMCPRDNQRDDQSNLSEITNGWCKQGDYCGMTLSDGSTTCSCVEQCVATGTCCGNAENDCDFNDTPKEPGYCQKWGNYCDYHQSFKDGSECSCAAGCSYYGDCCAGIWDDCGYDQMVQ